MIIVDNENCINGLVHQERVTCTFVLQFQVEKGQNLLNLKNYNQEFCF
jgi:hypothetical protein